MLHLKPPQNRFLESVSERNKTRQKDIDELLSEAPEEVEAACLYEGDGKCDDGGRGSLVKRCPCGTDVLDCGNRSTTRDAMLLCSARATAASAGLDDWECALSAAIIEERCGPARDLGVVLLLASSLFYLLHALVFATVALHARRLHLQVLSDAKAQLEVGAATLMQNTALLESLGLAPLLSAALDSAGRPAWLEEALPTLRLTARVVDYWASEASNELWQQLERYLTYLGFAVEVTTDEEQAKHACGYVAARAVITMRTAHATGGSWEACPLSDAAEARWVRAGNALLTNPLVVPPEGRPNIPSAKSAAMLAPWHVQALVRGFARQEAGLDVGECDEFDVAQSEWMPEVLSRDAAAASIVRTLHGVATGSGPTVPLRFIVANSHDSDSLLGRHWATVALSMERGAPATTDEGLDKAWA